MVEQSAVKSVGGGGEEAKKNMKSIRETQLTGHGGRANELCCGPAVSATGFVMPHMPPPPLPCMERMGGLCVLSSELRLLFNGPPKNNSTAALS